MRVLRRQLVTCSTGHADHHGHLRLAAEHVPDLGRVVDDLVERDQREVDGHHLDDRAQAEHGRADGGADDDLLCDRSVDHTVGAELVEQAVGHPIGATELPDVLADEKDILVALHLLGKRLAQGDAVELVFCHDYTGSLLSSGRSSHSSA